MNKSRVLCLIILVLTATIGIAFAEDAYFEFKDHRDTFIFKLSDSEKISHARKLLQGHNERVHVMGRIRKSRADYNPKWDFHLDPATISFFDMAIEVCDASISYVEDHLDEACGAFLPGCFYCPWSSKLTREIKVEELDVYEGDLKQDKIRKQHILSTQ